MSSDRRIPVALLLLRLSVFLVMLMWTLDKFVNPNHAAAVYQNFYLISGLSNQMFYIIGAIQLIIILGFVAGFQKRWTYWLDRHWIDWGWESRESHESQNQLT